MNENMANEIDDLADAQDDTRSASPSRGSKTFLLAAIGLVLMLGGYAAMNYVPPTPRPLAELREMAARSGTAAEGLDERLQQIAPSWRTPPYQIPGRLALYGGLALFITAGVRMYRHTPATRNESSETE